MLRRPLTSRSQAAPALVEALRPIARHRLDLLAGSPAAFRQAIDDGEL
jgi:hypothetical protein